MAVTRRRKAAPAPVAEVEETDAFEELDEIGEDDAEEAPAPKPTKRTRAAKKAAAPVEDAPAAKRTRKAAVPAATDDEGPSEYNTAWLAGHVSEVFGVEYTGRDVRMVLRKLAGDGKLERTVGEDRGRYTFPKGANDPIVKAVIAHIRSGESVSPARKAPAEVEETPAPAKRTRAAKATPAKKAAAPAKAAPSGRTRRTRAAAE